MGVGRTVLARKALRIHAMIASRAGSGLSLPTTGCGILHKEPLLSGSQFPQLSYRKPGPVPPPRCGHTGGQAGTESPLQTVKCRAVCRHSQRGGCAGRGGAGLALASHRGSPRSGPPPPSRSALPPSFPPPCPRGALAPGMLRAADSLINSRLCGRPARTGRAPLAPAPAAPLPQVSVCPSACLGARGAPLRGVGKPRAPGGRQPVCVGASLGFVRLCVCVGGYDPCVFWPVCSPQALLWVFVPPCVCPCGGMCVAVLPSLLDSRPFVPAGTPGAGAPGPCPWHVPAGARGRGLWPDSLPRRTWQGQPL